MALSREQILADLRRKYEQTYGQVVHDREALTAYVTHFVAEGATKIRCIARTLDRGEISFFLDTDYELKFRLPQAGCFGVEGKPPIYFARKPARQWQRGICMSNSSITSVLTAATLQFGLEYVDAIYNPCYKSLREIKELRPKGNIGFACNSDVAVAPHPDKDLGLWVIYFKLAPSAIMHKDGVEVKEPLMRQEIERLCSDQGVHCV